MIYKIISILCLIIIAFITNNYCYESDNESADCDPLKPQIPYLNHSSGELLINDINKRKGNESKCVWIVDNANKSIHLDISKLSIGLNDTLVITANDAKKTILYALKGFQLPGVILTKSSNITVTLSLTNEQIDRIFKVGYGSNDMTAQIQAIDISGSFVFPYCNTSLSFENFDFQLIFQTNLIGKQILVNFETFELNGGSVTFYDVVKYNATQSKDKDPPPFLLSIKDSIKISISKFKTTNTSKGIRLNYQLVDSLCTQCKIISPTELDTNYTINMPLPYGADLNFLANFKCFNLFEHQEPTAKLLLDLSKFKFSNRYDTITVLDGESRDSKLLALIEPQLFNFWTQQYLFSSSNKLSIIFDSPFVINKTSDIPILGVIPKSRGGNIHLISNSTTTLELKENPKTAKPWPVVFILGAEEGFQAVIDFDNDKILKGDPNKTLITIYDTFMTNKEPIVKLESNNYPPDIMASNSNFMRIEFNQIVDFSAKVSQVKQGCHSTVSDNSNSYSLSGCNALCSWFIPNRNSSDGTFILQFSHLYLPEETDSISIEKLGPQNSTVLSLKGKLKTTTFPDLNLDPSYSYILYTKRKCGTNTADNTNLLAVSFLYVLDDLKSHTFNISDVLNQTISTQSYPNYYSVGSDHIWNVNGKDKQKVLLTFTDINLISSHKLLIRSQNQTQTFNDTNVLSQTSDYLITLPLFLNLSSQSIGDKAPFSARGFSANLTSVQCGDAFTIQPNKTFNISTPNPLTDISKCIWTLTVPNDKTGLNLLEFNVNFGEGVNNSNNGLKIYDSNSMRDNQIMNLTYFNETKLSSTNSIIIVYSINDPKKPVSLTLNFTTTVCKTAQCDNSKRCILDEFYCNGFNDCGDWSDERWCNNTGPPPTPKPQPPPPPPQPRSGGVNGWVVLFIICPLCIGLGIVGTLFGPNLMSRFRRGRYREFQDFSEVS